MGEREDVERYEQRHLNEVTGKWSDWYPSNREAYMESKRGPVYFYEVRLAARPDEKGERAALAQPKPEKDRKDG